MCSQRGAAPTDQEPGGRWIRQSVCVTCGVLEGVGKRLQRVRCSGVRRVDVGRGSGVGCLAGSPWREAQESLMLSGSKSRRQQRKREGEWGKVGAGERKNEMRNEREKRLPVDQPNPQRRGAGGGGVGGR